MGSLTRAQLDVCLDQHGSMPFPHRPDGAESDKKIIKPCLPCTVCGGGATAGLHFTQALVERILLAGVEILPVTLHVGAGTFLPVS